MNDRNGEYNQELSNRYYHLAEIKLAGETRLGRHPSGTDQLGDVEPDGAVREVLEAGLTTIVREMAAVMHELSSRPDGLVSLLPDWPLKNQSDPKKEWVAARHLVDGKEYKVVGNKGPDGIDWFEVYAPNGDCISDDNPEHLPTEQQIRKYISAI